MSFPRRAFALPILFILLAVSSVTVFGQSDRQTVVNIPFDFIVGDKAMPAGRYILERNKRENDAVWTIKVYGHLSGLDLLIYAGAFRSETNQRDLVRGF